MKTSILTRDLTFSLTGHVKRLEQMEGFEQSRDLLIEEIDAGMTMTRPKLLEWKRSSNNSRKKIY